MENIKISEEEYQQLTVLQNRYEEVHEKIAELENKIRDIQFLKDILITELDIIRADEGMCMANLMSKYGDGKLDVMSLEWVLNNYPPGGNSSL